MSQAKAIRQFLKPVVDALGEKWTARFTLVPPVGLGLLLTAEGVPGHVAVTACTVVSGSTAWMGLEGPGDPHFQLYTYDADDEIASIARTCRLEHLICMIEAWRASRSPEAPASEARPITASERSYLADIARGLAAPVEIAMAFDPRSPGVELAPEGQRQLEATLVALDNARLALHFPRQDDGRLPLATDVLLAQLTSGRMLGRDRSLWLCASSPQRRSDGARLTLRISDFIARNTSHRWDAATWLFRSDVAEESLERQTLRALGKKSRPDDAVPAERAARCLRLLDAGRFSDALALYEVALDVNVIKVLAEVPLTFQEAPYAGPWAAVLRRTLWTLTPWKLRGLLDAERAAFAGRRGRTPELRLVTLPHQRHQRKAGLTLVEPKPGQASLTINWTASNARVPECQWRRSVIMDLKRFGMEVPVAATTTVRRIVATTAPLELLADALRGRRLWDNARARKLARARPVAQALAELLPLLRRGSCDERRNALHLYHELAAPRDAPPVVKLLHDPVSEIRAEALRTLRKLRHADATRQVAWLVIDDPDHLVRMEAATTLKALGGAVGNVRSLGSYLTSPDPLLRRAGCAALLDESRGIGPVVELLRGLLDDPDPAVAAAARKAARLHEVVRK